MSKHFPDLQLKSPIFYNSLFSIRFELGGDLSITEERANQVYHRVLTLFNAINQKQDEVFTVIFADSWEGHPVSAFEDKIIRIFQEYIAQEVDVSRSELEYRYREKDDDEDGTKTYRYCVKSQVKDINIEPLLKAKVNREMGLEPAIIGDLFIINSTNNTIFHLYDDRGLDVAAQNKETLRTLYTDYNNWILDYDRQRIDSVFITDSN